MSDLKGTISLKINVDDKELAQLEKRFSDIQSKANSIRQSAAGTQFNQGKNVNDAQKIDQSNQKDRKGLEDSLKINKQIESSQSNQINQLKQIASLQNQIAQQGQQAAQTAQQTAQTAQQQATKGGGAGGGAGGAGGAGGGGAGGVGPFGIKFPSLSKGLGLAGSAVTMGGQLYKQVETYPERIAQREASIAGMQSEMMRLQMQGKGYEMSLFAPERAKALERAQTRVGAEKASDATGLLGTVLGGAALGAAGGSAFFGLGAIPGAIIGGATAFGGAMLSDRKRSMLFDREAYEKEMGSVFAGTYKEQLEAERAKSYQKDMAGQFFEQQSGRFRGLQRQFGLSDEELFLGDQSVFRKAARGGYGMDTMTQAMQGISAAGGPTGVAVRGAGIAAQMQRNLDLTNAPQLLGRVAGGTGMDEIRSRDEIIRMYAEATRIGLDTSETRDFLQAAADMGYKTGGNLETISNLLSAGVQGTGLQGSRGVEAAQGALEKIRQQTSEMGGLTGQYGIAELQGEGVTEALGGQSLDMKQTAYLLGTDITKISDEYLQYLLESKGQKAGPEEIKKLREQVVKAKTKSITRTAGQERALEQYQKTQEAPGVYSPEAKREAYGEAASEFGIVQGSAFLGQGIPEQKAELGILGAGLQGAISPDLSKKIEETEQKYKTQTGRMTDEAEKSAAMDAAGSLSNLKDQADALREAFKENVKMGEEAKKVAQNLANLATILEKVENPSTRSEIQETLNKMQSSQNNQSAPQVVPQIYGNTFR